MGASRRGERTPGKSDQIDALAIARAVVKDGVDAFPAAYLDERAMEIRLLSDHRSDLVAERTRMQSRVRWHLLALCPELEASLKPRSLDRSGQLDREPEQQPDRELLAASRGGAVEREDARERGDEQQEAGRAAQIAAELGAERGESDGDGDAPHDLAQ
jgi:transposase